MLKEKIYDKLKKVPRGKVITYKDLSHSVNIKAYRYVGSLMKKNPYKSVPCHRVINSNLETGSYSGKGGRKGKIKILKREGVKINKGIVDKSCLYKFK